MLLIVCRLKVIITAFAVEMKGKKAHPLSARLRFADQMKRIRKEKGLSQEDLADLCNLHRTYIGSVERGERNIAIDNMEKIALALEVELSTLVQG